jgi:transcriptional regulator with XRE-family HTH domain
MRREVELAEQDERLIGLRNLRRSMGFSQAELGEMVGVGQDAISNYERGIRFPAPRHLRALAEALGCSIPDLFREQHLSAPKSPAPSRQHLAQIVQARGGSGFWFLTTDELKKAASSSFELRNIIRQLARTQRIVREMLAEGGLARGDRKALQRIAREYTGKLVALTQRVDAVLEAEARELTAELEAAMAIEQEANA